MKQLTFKQFWELSEIYTAPLNLLLSYWDMLLRNFSLTAHSIQNFSIRFDHRHVPHYRQCFNHYMDYRNASDENYKQHTNIIGRDHLICVLCETFIYLI